ncbi:retrovirus-related Pol polyprotein from transposon 297 [Trichonephila clavipes]|nr:retrovirus-related Pol polyprotein from transposon 297 [Trichonephila clavipes]
MPFGLSRVAPNFQKAIDILKPVIGKLVSVYMNDFIILSPSFTQHIEHLKEVFRLLQDAGLTLNKDKCKFGCDELKYLGLIINKERMKTDETKVRSIVEMKSPRNSKEASKFLAVNETTGKTPEELFLGRMLITPFQKLVMVSDRTEFAVGDIERLFEKARRNTKAKHEKWEKYYNRRRRDVQIKVNDWILIATHPLSSATKKW